MQCNIAIYRIYDNRIVFIKMNYMLLERYSYRFGKKKLTWKIEYKILQKEDLLEYKREGMNRMYI